eukprot:COSAG01_NODE_18943_length_1042_cov_1.014846_2_plen_158_part_00
MVGACLQQRLRIPQRAARGHGVIDHDAVLSRRARLPLGDARRPFPDAPFPSSIRDQNRRDIGKSQSIWTDSKMETAGSQLLHRAARLALLAQVSARHTMRQRHLLLTPPWSGCAFQAPLPLSGDGGQRHGPLAGWLAGWLAGSAATTTDLREVTPRQ